MKRLTAMTLAMSLYAGLSVRSEALEFTADRITRTDRGLHHARIFYRDEMWRLEHNGNGPVSITIVRQDRDQVWHLMPSTRHFKVVSFHHDYALHLTTGLENEKSREAIGTQQLDGHPTTLYEVTVSLPGGQIETYYQWIATDIQFTLKLAKKNGDWMVEYRHVKLGPIADSFFQLPHRYLPWNGDPLATDDPSVPTTSNPSEEKS